MGGRAFFQRELTICLLHVPQLDGWLVKRTGTLPGIVWRKGDEEPDFEAGIGHTHGMQQLLAQQEVAVKALKSRGL